MITINVHLDVISEKKEEYLKFVEDLVITSKNEKGCLLYNHYSNLYEENKFIIVENWENQSALDQHNNTKHLQKFIDEISNYLTSDFIISISKA